MSENVTNNKKVDTFVFEFFNMHPQYLILYMALVHQDLTKKPCKSLLPNMLQNAKVYGETPCKINSKL